MFKHLSTHNIPCSDQQGFRKHHSCDSQLLTTIEDFSRHVVTGAQIDVIFLDFSKAFDKVSHQCLFLKLAHYGIQGTVLNWIKDFLTFLTNRTQQIVLNNITIVVQLMYCQVCPRALSWDIFYFCCISFKVNTCVVLQCLLQLMLFTILTTLNYHSCLNTNILASFLQQF